MINQMLFSQFIKPHQYATINGNSEGRVFYFKIPASTAGFIQQIASNWFSNTKLKFIIDGEIVEDKIERSLAPIDEPRNLNPPWLVKNYIEIRAENNDSTSHLFEVLIDGILAQELI